MILRFSSSSPSISWRWRESTWSWRAISASCCACSCRRDPNAAEETLLPRLDAVLEHVPAPRYDPAMPLKLQVTTLDYDDYIGRLAIDRIYHGDLAASETILRCPADGEVERAEARITGLYGYEGLARTAIDSAGPGDIVAVAGLDEIGIGDTLCDPEDPRPLPPIVVDEPTITMAFGVNDSPFSGCSGKYLTSRKLRERLLKETLINVSIRV